MSCDKCNKSCSCGSTKGERGLQGLQGIQGELGPAGPAGGGIVNKINFFEELTSKVIVNGVVFYHPVGYDVLSYTNNTGVTRIFAVHATVQTHINSGNLDDIVYQVQAAIVKTVVGVDTYSYIHNLEIFASGRLYDDVGPADSLTILSPIAPNQVLTTAGNPVEFRFRAINVQQGAALLKKITLNDGETVTIKFKNKGIDSTLIGAQIFVQELDQ